MSSRSLPPAAWLAALVSLPGMGPRRLRTLVEGRAPADAWQVVRSGRVAEVPGMAAVLVPEGRRLVDRWVTIAGRRDVAALWCAHEGAGVSVLTADDSRWPACFEDDPDPPVVLFTRGDAEPLSDSPRVAVVGTRRCTRAGVEIAQAIGRELGDAGVGVVSGLALGIDGAAHAGALAGDAGAPIGVVGNGLDVVYPRRHRRLYEQIIERGLLLSEYPLGFEPKSWTFPARNRVIAALADLVVVVESHQAGGSQYTVDEAIERDRPVCVVPGSVHSRACQGTNRLLVDGLATAVRGADDILLKLGVGFGRRHHGAPSPSGDEALLDDVGFEPTSLEQVVVRSGLSLAELHERLEALEREGWIVERSGWYERVTPAVER